MNRSVCYIRIVKKRFIALLLLAGGFVFGQVSIGIRIGPPPPPRVVRVLPARPGPEFVWVDGYWYPVGNHYRWHSGYWSRPVYPAARWVAPRHDGERFYGGYWDGDRGRMEHDHHWDRDHDRDYRDRDRR
jgi:hypothetical protein